MGVLLCLLLSALTLSAQLSAKNITLRYTEDFNFQSAQWVCFEGSNNSHSRNIHYKKKNTKEITVFMERTWTEMLVRNVKFVACLYLWRACSKVKHQQYLIFPPANVCLLWFCHMDGRCSSVNARWRRPVPAVRPSLFTFSLKWKLPNHVYKIFTLNGFQVTSPTWNCLKE